MSHTTNIFFLLADDDCDDAELFGEALASLEQPVRFHHVENGRGIFDYLSNPVNAKPDLIFLDLNMPQMSGWQCLAKLQNDVVFKRIPVIMYSTSSHPRDREIAIDLGAHGFITKPTDYKELRRILQSIAANLFDDLKKTIRNMEWRAG